MKVKPNLHGLNEQYRAACGTLRPFTSQPGAWFRLNRKAIMERRAREKKYARLKKAKVKLPVEDMDDDA